VNGIALHPIEASTVAPEVDLMFYSLLAFSLGLGLVLTILVLRFAIVYRRGSRADRSDPHKRDPLLEMGWTIGAAVVALGLFVWGANGYIERDHPPEGSIVVAGFGKQWMWRFQHDNGRREINELHVPKDRPVVVRLAAEDVIHSFYVPAFRVKQDAVPGHTTQIWFEASRTGTYDLFCAEYCGTQHSRMRGRIIVMEPEDFAAWLAAGPATQSIAEEGEALFRSLGCSGCHGPNSAIRAPDLHNVYGHPVALQDGTVRIADQQYIRDSILQPERDVAAGYEPVMPSFADLVSEDELMKLVTYVKSLATEHSP